MTEQILKYATVISVAMIAVIILLLVVIEAARGISLESAQLVPLLATVGTLVGIVVSLLRGGQNATKINEVKQLVNGHLQAHIGHTDAQINSMIDTKLEGVQAGASALEPRTTQDPGSGG